MGTDGQMVSEEFTLRPAEAGDVAPMREVSRISRGRDGLDQGAAIADSRSLVLVIERDGVVVAWAKTHFYASAGGEAPAGEYLGGVSVLPEFQRRGLGRALTRARLDWIGERAPAAWFFTSAGNTASIELHTEFGFREIARAAEFHGVSFDGGSGILFRSTLRVN